jgi:mRNA-decapping enzyme subunit 2
VSPFLDAAQFPAMWHQFSDYKRKISTYGTILLNTEATHIVLVRVYDGNTWTLPAGKINQGERGIEAAARETYEETGFDPHGLFGLAKDQVVAAAAAAAAASEATSPPPPSCAWQNPLLEQDALAYQDPNGKRRTAYICQGVPMDFPFLPVARKEVSEIKWFDLNDLPKKSFAILPFMGKLRKWIRKKFKKQNKRDKSRSKSASKEGRDKSNPRDKSNGRDKSTGRDKPNNRRNSMKSRLVRADDDPLVDSGLANVGDTNRWSEEDMFKVNEELIGRKVDYDGNPHVFSEKGLSGGDPHAFRVVGGTFMNSNDGTIECITKEQQVSKYQPLHNNNLEGQQGQDQELQHHQPGAALPLTPFFTNDGATPWGEVVEEAKNAGPPPEAAEANAGEALLAMLQKPVSKVNAESTATTTTTTSQEEEDPLDVMTDSQITKRSQERYQKQKLRLQQQYEEDQRFIDEWVQQLPRPIEFKIKNVDAILQQAFG